MQKIRLSEIVTNSGTQTRADLDPAVCDEYREHYLAGDTFPPLDVFRIASKFVLVDGFHRLRAASSAGLSEIDCAVHTGTLLEALKFALGANQRHGLRRTNADKRRAVEMSLQAFPELSNREHALLCGVTHPFVANVKALVTVTTLSPSQRSGNSKPPPNKQIYSDGVARSQPPTAAPPKLDGIGQPIPSDLLIAWSEAAVMGRALRVVNEIRGHITRAQSERNVLFSEMNIPHALSHLDSLCVQLNSVKPFVLCPTCHGATDERKTCAVCDGRGFVSEVFLLKEKPPTVRPGAARGYTF
jgi:hypothetical protein